ncbi:HD domain-containing protein [Anaerophilus nitritogenes]|uniref:HD domain-containing protein n=1 Tax=Anaerophilus nitritogenes TaxID=2498136 RepID=UPI00101D392C|nr:HD domain-containing protein [Anaerophilus nitritogenes]
MNRINKILTNSEYISYLKQNEEAEKKRVFCHHDLSHALDVARIAYILNLEKKLSIPKEIIYAAALLHDIGRWKEYKDKTDHAIVSAQLSENILIQTDFNQKESKQIIHAIFAHRQKDLQKTLLDEIIYESDKSSRNCFTCKAIQNCKNFINQEKPILTY